MTVAVVLGAGGSGGWGFHLGVARALETELGLRVADADRVQIHALTLQEPPDDLRRLAAVESAVRQDHDAGDRRPGGRIDGRSDGGADVRRGRLRRER